MNGHGVCLFSGALQDCQEYAAKVFDSIMLTCMEDEDVIKNKGIITIAHLRAACPLVLHEGLSRCGLNRADGWLPTHKDGKGAVSAIKEVSSSICDVLLQSSGFSLATDEPVLGFLLCFLEYIATELWQLAGSQCSSRVVSEGVNDTDGSRGSTYSTSFISREDLENAILIDSELLKTRETIRKLSDRFQLKTTSISTTSASSPSPSQPSGCSLQTRARARA